MKLGDKVYAQGIVDEIRGSTVIIKSGDCFFGVNKKNIVPENMILRRDNGPKEYIFEADRYTVVMGGSNIHVIDANDPSICVSIDHNPLHFSR